MHLVSKGNLLVSFIDLLTRHPEVGWSAKHHCAAFSRLALLDGVVQSSK